MMPEPKCANISCVASSAGMNGEQQTPAPAKLPAEEPSLIARIEAIIADLMGPSDDR